MYQKVRQLLTAPTFLHDPDKTDQSAVLNMILWLSLICMLFFGLATPFIYVAVLPPLMITVALLLVIVANIFLLRWGYVQLASYFFCGGVWLSLVLLAFWMGGVDTDSYKLSFIAILTTGVLCGVRMAFVATGLNVLAGLLMVVAQKHQLVPMLWAESSTPMSVWFSMMVVFVVTAVWLYITTDRNKRIMAHLEASAAELASQKAALAQERALTKEVEETLRRTAERLTILHYIEQAILAAKSTEEIAITLLKHIQRLIPCQRASLALFDFEKETALLFAVALTDDTPPDVGQQLPLSDFSSLPVLLEGRHYVMEDLLEVERLTELERKRYDEEGVRSYINVPLMVRHQLVGSLNLAATQPNPWQEEHIMIAYEIATQLAIAVEQTRLLATAERKANQLDTLRQMSLELTADLDLTSLLRSVVFQATKILGASDGNLFLYQAEDTKLELVAKHGVNGLAVGYKIELTQGITGKAWRTGEVQIVSNYALWAERDADILKFVGAASLISIPIQGRGEQLGVLTVRAKEGDSFATADAELLSLFAANAYVAIYNARLHEAVQQYVDQLEQEVIERKQVEQALQEQRDFAEQVMQQMGQGLAVTDTEERFTFVNKAFAEIVGRPPQELLGVNPKELHHMETAKLEAALAERRLGRTNSYELRLQRADGRWADIWVTGVPRWQGEKVVGSIAVITDLTAQKQAEQEREALIAELEAKNAELGRFTYTVSHDLKSPLVTVKGFLGFLEQDIRVGAKERVQQDIHRIREATERMQLLLNDLLELSRIGRISNPPQLVSFNDLVEEAMNLVSGAITERGVQVVQMQDMPSVWVDKARLVQVLQNLLDNGVKFMGEQAQPSIMIGWREEADGAVFFVKDNGMGIEPKFQERVFGLFERLNTAVDGTGIGLALVKRIVKVHNGRIWIESDGLGQGTAVCFTLPTSQSHNR